MLLSYSNERILTHQAHIHPYFPLVRVEVAADAVLFRPQAGMRLGKHGCCLGVSLGVSLSCV